jgi:hypothetical protein
MLPGQCCLDGVLGGLGVADLSHQASQQKAGE